MNYGTGRYKVMGTRRLGAVSLMLPSVLSEELKFHRNLIAKVEVVLADYSSEKVSAAVMSVMIPTAWQGDVTAIWNEHARIKFPSHMAVHRKELGNESEGRIFVGSLEPFSRQVVHEMVASGTEGDGA